jgi:hypothetical protein
VKEGTKGEGARVVKRQRYESVGSLSRMDGIISSRSMEVTSF